jgi:hypothetical protein
MYGIVDGLVALEVVEVTIAIIALLNRSALLRIAPSAYNISIVHNHASNMKPGEDGFLSLSPCKFEEPIVALLQTQVTHRKRLLTKYS